MLKKTIKKILNQFLPDRFNYVNKNAKFSNLDENDTIEKIKKIQNILGLGNKIELKLLSEKTVYMKKL